MPNNNIIITLLQLRSLICSYAEFTETSKDAVEYAICGTVHTRSRALTIPFPFKAERDILIAFPGTFVML
jgi:hypothetical protein